MKLTFLFACIFFFRAGATSAAQTVTLSLKSKPLVAVLLEIKRQTGYDLF
jgi:hypothetical protein